MDRTLRQSRVAYRAFLVNEQGRLGGVPRIIEADDDRDAAFQAERLVGCQAVELWDGARLVARLQPSPRDCHHPTV